MMVTVLDLNTDRVWALSGAAGKAGRLVFLDGDRAELPLILSLAERKFKVGHKALSLCRASPHLICQDFLPLLGNGREWRHGWRRFDSTKALAVLFTELRPSLPADGMTVFALPAYLSREQTTLVAKLAKDSGLHVGGMISRLLAAGLYSFRQHAWHNIGVFVDVDDYALSVAVLRPAEKELRVLHHQALRELGMRLWKERLLGCIAEQCIRTSRRDPRESPEAEQMIANQIDQVFDQCSRNEPATLQVQGRAWLQTVNVPPSQAALACSALARETASVAIFAVQQWADQELTSATIYFTAGAARLPGLAAAVYAASQNKTPVVVLPPDAAAQAGYELGQRIARKEVSPGFFDQTAPLPQAKKVSSRLIPFPGKISRAVGK